VSLQVTLMQEQDLADLRPYVDDEAFLEGVRRRLKGEGLSLSVRHQGRLLACGGVHLFFPGVGEAWFQPTPLSRRHPKATWAAVTRWLPEAMNLLGLWRVQCAVRTDFPEACRFVEHLGFVREGVMVRFDPAGQDAALYALVRKEGPWSPP
jgi:hypothetical protein